MIASLVPAMLHGGVEQHAEVLVLSGLGAADAVGVDAGRSADGGVGADRAHQLSGFPSAALAMVLAALLGHAVSEGLPGPTTRSRGRPAGCWQASCCRPPTRASCWA